MTTATPSIREQRLRRGWTQEDLAQHCADAGVHVTHTTISKIERGAQVPRPKLRAVLADLLDLDVVDLERRAS